MKVQTQSNVRFLIGILIVVGIVGSSYGQPITELFDFVNQRDEVEWMDLNENAVALNGRDEDLNVVRIRQDNVPSGIPRMGDFYAEPLYLRSKSNGDGQTYGILGRTILSIPEHRYVQFQGTAEILNGKDNGSNILLQVEKKSGNQHEWVHQRTYYGQRNGDRNTDRELVSFISDLSQWGSDEIRVSLIMRVTPSLLTSDGERQIRPDEISAQWITAEIVSSKIKVVIGKEERINLPSALKAKPNEKRPSFALIPSATISGSTSNEELVLDGQTSDGVGCMKNPSDSPLPTFYAPASGSLDGRFVCYLSAVLNEDNEPHGQSHGGNSPEGVYGGSSRLIDFLLSSGNNMYSASVDEITSAVYIDNGTAVAVLSPSGDASRDFDDHYTSITTAAVDTLDDGNETPVIHAFFHAEDHFQFDGGSAEDHNHSPFFTTTPHMASIGYARSFAGSDDFGRALAKTSSTSGLPAITYQLAEEQVNMPTTVNYNHRPVWGCASPCVYAVSDCYYLIYHTYSWNKEVTSASTTNAMISLARAWKSDVNSEDYSSNSNPWKKFKEVNTTTWDAIENFTEPGLGGEFSGLWNVKKESGKRTDQADNRSVWRAFPKVSYNEFLDNAGNFDRPIVMMTHGPNGFYLHTATNLSDWDGGLFIKMDTGEYYPTLIGTQGYDSYTTEYNKLYYFKRDSTDNTGELYRSDAQLIIVP